MEYFKNFFDYMAMQGAVLVMQCAGLVMQCIILAIQCVILVIQCIMSRGGIATISLIAIAVISTAILSGFIPKVKTTNIVTDTVLVESVNHVPLRMYTTFVNTGKSMTPIVNTIPEKNLVTFRYKDNAVKVDNSSIYDAVKDRVGKDVVCELRITDFDDNVQSIKVKKVLESN